MIFAGAAERFRVLVLRPGELLKKVRLTLRGVQPYNFETVFPAFAALDHANKIRDCTKPDLARHESDEHRAYFVFRPERDFSFGKNFP
jgi:hypothetical protein